MKIGKFGGDVERIFEMPYGACLGNGEKGMNNVW